MAQYCVHYLFLAFIWHLAVFPQLSFSAGVDKQSTFRFSQQAVRRCLRNCHPVTRIPIKAKQIPSQQSCMAECLEGKGKQDSPRILHQIKPLMKRIKREASGNSTDNSKSPDDSYDCSKGCKNCTNATKVLFPTNPRVTFYKLDNTDRYYANISWDSLQNNTVQWTGYQVTYHIGSFGNPAICKPNLAKSRTYYVVRNSSYGVGFEEGTRFIALIASYPFVRNSKNEANFEENLVWQCQVPWTCTLSGYTTHLPSSVGSTPSITPGYSTHLPTSGYTTHLPSSVGSTPSITPGYSTHLPTSDSGLASYVVLIIVILGVFLLTGVATYAYRKRKERKPFVLYTESTAEFDAFIIYSSFDEQFVNEILLPTLETKYGLRCCIHYRDFKPGVPFRDNMVESVYKSRKTIAVMSHNFFTSQYCSGELDIALDCSLKRKDDSVVVIKVDDVDRNKLPKALKCRSYIDYTKSKEKETWEHKMIKCFKTPEFCSEV